MKIGAMVTVEKTVDESFVKDHLKRQILDEIWKHTTVKYQRIQNGDGTVTILAKAEVGAK